MPEDVAAKLETVSDEIDAISAKLFAYDAKVIAHGGAFVVLHHDGTVRIERGFVRLEDEELADPRPEPEGAPGGKDPPARGDALGQAGAEGVQEDTEDARGETGRRETAHRRGWHGPK